MDTIRLSFGIISTILLILIPIPQILHTLRQQDASQLSLYFILFQILANLFFCIYGIIISDIFLIISNGMLVLQNLFLLFLKNYYHMKNNNMSRVSTIELTNTSNSNSI